MAINCYYINNNSFHGLQILNHNTQEQWCSGKFSLVGTLAGHYGHIPYCYRGVRGGTNLCSNIRGGGYFF